MDIDQPQDVKYPVAREDINVTFHKDNFLIRVLCQIYISSPVSPSIVFAFLGYAKTNLLEIIISSI